MLGLVELVVAKLLTRVQQHGVIVQDVHQLARALLDVLHLTDALANLTCCRVIIVSVATYYRGMLGIIIEVEHLRTRMSERCGVDIEAVERLVIRNEEGIVGTHGKEVELEVYTKIAAVLNGPVHNPHVGI